MQLVTELDVNVSALYNLTVQLPLVLFVKGLSSEGLLY